MIQNTSFSVNVVLFIRPKILRFFLVYGFLRVLLVYPLTKKALTGRQGYVIIMCSEVRFFFTLFCMDIEGFDIQMSPAFNFTDFVFRPFRWLGNRLAEVFWWSIHRIGYLLNMLGAFLVGLYYILPQVGFWACDLGVSGLAYFAKRRHDKRMDRILSISKTFRDR